MKTYVINTSNSPYSLLKPVPIENVKLMDNFWLPRIEKLKNNTLPMQYCFLEKTDRINRFRWASGKLSVKPEKSIYPFDDSDVYKWLEACAFMLAQDPKCGLKNFVNEVVSEIIPAQEDDGYLFTEYHNQRSRRWTNLTFDHELYCAGHLIQAAIALHRSIENTSLLNTAIKFANLISETFNSKNIRGVPGHPEIEMALIELYRETDNKRYLETALFFLNERGKGLLKPVGNSMFYLYDLLGAEYFIDHKPFRELDEMVGHAVRSLYLNCGATDIYLETGEETIFKTLIKLWKNFVNCKMYITGGAGSRYISEAFGENYELPNERAYAETCAAIANIMWNWRMFLATGNAKFTDIMELALYNAALAGISLDGTKYFYTNPLADRGKVRRQPWFKVSCCPPNIARLIASLPGYFYSISSEGIWINLFASSKARINYRANIIEVVQRTNYPWDGVIEITVNPLEIMDFALFIRIPGWADRAYADFNKKKIKLKPGTYAKFMKKWSVGDKIMLYLEMPAKLMIANPHVMNNFQRVAIKRGPLIYCIEQEDNPTIDVWNIMLRKSSKFFVEYRRDLLGGVMILKSRALIINGDIWKEKLYQTYQKPLFINKEVEVIAIPYYTWANRAPGPMTVWIPILSG